MGETVLEEMEWKNKFRTHQKKGQCAHGVSYTLMN